MPTGQTKQVTDDKCEGQNQGENIRKHLTHHVKPNNTTYLDFLYVIGGFERLIKSLFLDSSGVSLGLQFGFP